MRSGFPTGAHWRDQKGGSFRASCLSHTSASLAAMVWCTTFFDHQFRGISFFFFRGKDGDGNSTEHPWGSWKTDIDICILIFYTHHTLYIYTNRCISRRGVYWSPPFFGEPTWSISCFPNDMEIAFNNLKNAWKDLMASVGWGTESGGLFVESGTTMTYPSLYKDGAFFKRNPLKRTSTKRLVKYSSFESGWLTSIGFLRSRKLLKETCWSRLVMENMVWIYRLYSLIPDLQIDIPTWWFQPSFLHNFIFNAWLATRFFVFGLSDPFAKLF